MSEPKSILKKAIKDQLLMRMEALGFQYRESQLKFKRRKGHFSQELWFRGSENNWGTELVQFLYQFVILHSKYISLLKKMGERIHASSSIVRGNREPLIAWDRSKESGFGYDFANMDHEEIMNDIYKNLIITGLPYFNMNDTDEKIARTANGKEKIDFHILIGDLEAAKAICESTIEGFNKLPVADRQKYRSQMDLWMRRHEYLKTNNSANDSESI